MQDHLSLIANNLLNQIIVTKYPYLDHCNKSNGFLLPCFILRDVLLNLISTTGIEEDLEKKGKIVRREKDMEKDSKNVFQTKTKR